MGDMQQNMSTIFMCSQNQSSNFQHLHKKNHTVKYVKNDAATDLNGFDTK